MVKLIMPGLLVLLVACAHAPPAPAAEPLRVVVLSDLNSAYGSLEYEPEVGHAVARTIRDWRPDLVLIAGDMVAGQRPALDDARVAAMWAAFDSVVAAPLRDAGIPLAVTMGNHDASGHPGHERDRRLAAEYWRERPPGVEVLDGDRYPFHYAFTRGGASAGGRVFFLVLDASTGAVAADSAQMAWIRRTLDGPEARSAGMRVSLGHVPLYPVAVGRDRPGEVQAEADSLRAVLERGGVRLHVSGHHHAYYPGRRGELELLHAGALGQGPRPLLGSDAPPVRTVTVLDLFPARDSIAERTYRVEGDRFEAVDPAGLPRRIDGQQGFVIRRDVPGGSAAAVPAAGASDTSYTVVSFNIRAGTDLGGAPSLDRVAAFLDSLGADVVLLQEVDRETDRSGGIDQLAELRRMTGMHGVFARAIDFDGGEYGIGLLSRWPIADHVVVPLTAELPPGLEHAAYEPRVLLHARLASPWGELSVLNTHLSHEAFGTYRRQELVGLLADLHRRAGPADMAIVGGDLNAVPGTDEIEAVSLALADAWTLCGTGDGETFPSDAPVRRIDYVFLRGLGCAVARVPATTMSDHRPLVVEVVRPGGR